MGPGGRMTRSSQMQPEPQPSTQPGVASLRDLAYSCCDVIDSCTSIAPSGRNTRSSQTQPEPQPSQQSGAPSFRVMGPVIGRTTRSSQMQLEPEPSTQLGVASPGRRTTRSSQMLPEPQPSTQPGVASPGRRTTKSSQMQPEPQPSTQLGVASFRGGQSTSSSAVPSSVPSSSTQSDNVPNSSAHSANGSTPVTRRGKAKNNTLFNHITRKGQKPRIEIPPGKSKPVGDWSQQFASEVGIICCKYAPLSLYNWRKVKKEYNSKVQTMHGHILKSFDIDIYLPHVESSINKYLGQRLKEFRCRLHVYYKTLSNDQRRRKPYDNVTQEDWDRLCDWFETDKFKKLSTINKASRAKKKVNHCGGSRSFLNHRADKREAQTQEEPGRIEFYRMMYYNPGKGWSGSAQENYDEMLEMQSQSLEEGSTPMTEDDIANKVLGAKPGYIGGLGHGVDPMSSSSSYYYSEVEELRRRAEVAERQAEEYQRQAQELTTRLHENEDKVEELQNWKAASEAKLDFLMAHIGATFSVNDSTS